MLQLSFDTAKSGGGKQIVISSETARKLKEAGLRWEPQIGDWYYHADKWGEILSPQPFLVDPRVLKYGKIGLSDVFAPRLDQLLAEIEKRGYRYILLRYDPEQQEEGQEEQYEITLIKNGNSSLIYTLYEDSIDEVAAQALLWILEREKEGQPDDQA